MRAIQLVAIVLVLLLCACSSTNSNPIVAQTPPKPREEVASSRPGDGSFWKDGHWGWDESSESYYWVAGTWTRERKGWVWFPGYWEEVLDEGGRRKGWQWVDEHWERASAVTDQSR